MNGWPVVKMMTKPYLDDKQPVERESSNARMVIGLSRRNVLILVVFFNSAASWLVKSNDAQVSDLLQIK